MTPIPAPEAPVLRLEPSLPLPAYRYVPGLLPHPFRDPRGHDHLARLHLPEPPWAPGADWTHNVHHRYALDLFHARFYWECHEVWEGVWLKLPRPSAERALIQALIQVAAGALKRHMGNARARDSLYRTARARLTGVRAEGAVRCGVDVDHVVRQLDERVPWPTLVLVGFPEAP